jgi:hypothetical protein
MWVISLVDDNQNPINLTNAASVALTFKPQIGNSFVGTGTATILTPLTSGQISYQVSATDVALDGEYRIFVKVTYTTGNPSPFTFDPIDLTLIWSS